jgi:glucosyl-dolichyl phosphate glucuronosyltransferase
VTTGLGIRDGDAGTNVPASRRPLDVTVLIATYNRAVLLDETLTWIARMRVSPALTWEAIVIDNNSTDDTRAVVERHIHEFPVRLRYLFEGRQGRSSALNAGIAEAGGSVLAFTDDDVRVVPGWLDAAARPLLGPDPTLAYTGGPVRPIWGADPPDWLDLTRGDLWGTIAIQHHGDISFIYEEGQKVPLGANMAVRREMFARLGAFRADLGRSGGRLVLGQEVPELLLRARGAGLQGLYVPEMQVHHHVPASRLTRQYFRRWWFGKGVSRSALERLQPLTELGVDLRMTPHLLGVPRFMYGSVLRDVAGMLRERLRGRPAAAFRHEVMAVYFAGYCWSRWRRRRAGLPRWRRRAGLTPAQRPQDERSEPAPTAQRTSKVVTTGR